MTVLLLHAFPLDERMWDPQREALRGYDVAAPRLYARGRTIDQWADSLLAEVAGPVTAVGASMGGYVALAMARRAPERLRALVLAGSRADADAPERREARNKLIETLRAGGVEAFRPVAPFPPPDGVAADELIGALEVLRDRPDATETVRRFAGPLLVVAGEHDELLPADEARAIAHAAPDARVEIVPRAGHIVSRDDPARFNRLLLDFLREAGEPHRV